MAEQNTYFAVVNARMHRNKKAQIIELLTLRNIPFTETTCADDAIWLARNSDASVVIAAGGDGTVHEVLNGIDVDRQKILVVPAGSLNCIARGFKLGSIADSLALIDTNTSVVKVDYLDTHFVNAAGIVTERKILGFVSAGYDGSVARFARKMRFVYPPLRYILAGWAAAAVAETDCVKINTADHEFTKKFTSLLINNCSADMFSTVKKWNVQDGTAELKYVNLPSVTHIPYAILSRMPLCGKFTKGVPDILCRWKKPLHVMADGEMFANIVSVSVTVRHEILQLVLPPDAQVRR